MTTAHSPLRVLKEQADRIAKILKAASRGEVPTDPGDRLATSLKRDESVKVGVVMDDKVIKIEIPWKIIRGTSEVGIAEWILRHMREQREATH